MLSTFWNYAQDVRTLAANLKGWGVPNQTAEAGDCSPEVQRAATAGGEENQKMPRIAAQLALATSQNRHNEDAGITVWAFLRKDLTAAPLVDAYKAFRGDPSLRWAQMITWRSSIRRQHRRCCVLWFPLIGT